MQPLQDHNQNLTRNEKAYTIQSYPRFRQRNGQFIKIKKTNIWI